MQVELSFQLHLHILLMLLWCLFSPDLTLITYQMPFVATTWDMDSCVSSFLNDVYVFWLKVKFTHNLYLYFSLNVGTFSQLKLVNWHKLEAS